MTTMVEHLVPETLYYFKMQARNDKGYGPMSGTVRYRTPKLTVPPGVNRHKAKSDGISKINFDEDKNDKNGMVTEVLIIAVGSGIGVLLVVLAIVGAVCFCRNKRQR